MVKALDLLSVGDFSVEALGRIVRAIEDMKKNPVKYKSRLDGKIIVMLFEKPSTRTRVSFESAMLQLGGHFIDLSPTTTQLGRGETVADSARVLGRYASAIVARVQSHETLKELAEYSDVPVINGLSDLEHPCQAVADLYSIYEVKGRLKGTSVSYVGDGNNVCNSLMLGCAMTGVNLKVATPKKYRPSKEILGKAAEIAKDSCGRIEVLDDPGEAVSGADFVYTDVWISMGQEGVEEEKLRAFDGFQVNDALLSKAAGDARVMHCLPAHRGVEISSEVLDGPRSIVWDQAENRLHAQKAILLYLLSKEPFYL